MTLNLYVARVALFVDHEEHKLFKTDFSVPVNVSFFQNFLDFVLAHVQVQCCENFPRRIENST